MLTSFVHGFFGMQGVLKVNLVAALVRGMSVEDALDQLAVSPKRAAKTVSKVSRLRCTARTAPDKSLHKTYNTVRAVHHRCLTWETV